MALTVNPLKSIPLVKTGDSIPKIILSGLEGTGITLQSDDIFVIAQKIISKSEGRSVRLSCVTPSQEALTLSREVDKDPRLVELILQESKEIVRKRPGAVIVEHTLGFVCANAGIDHSNVDGDGSDPEDWVLLLPKDPDQSAKAIRTELEKVCEGPIGVLIIDSHGRAWRNGIVGTTIGVSGIPALTDMRGQPDLLGYKLRITQIGTADELAAAASLMMGQAAEGTPIIHIRGFPYPLRESSLSELIRSKETDLFR